MSDFNNASQAAYLPVFPNTSDSNSQTETPQVATSTFVTRQSLIPRSNYNFQSYLTEPIGNPNSLSGNEYILSSTNNPNSLNNIRAFIESSPSGSGNSSAFEYIRNTINRIRESDSSYVHPPAAGETNRITSSSRPPVYNNRPQSASGVRSTNTAPNAARPQFRSKSVCALACKYCANGVCRRGMKAILLADMAVELFSTDLPPTGVALVNDDYQTRKCHCRIRDVACFGCGNVIGYHVTQPCQSCMEACNNGHFWMFHVDHVKSSERMNHTGTIPLLWANLSKPDHDIDKTDSYDVMCR